MFYKIVLLASIFTFAALGFGCGLVHDNGGPPAQVNPTPGAHPTFLPCKPCQQPIRPTPADGIDI